MSYKQTMKWGTKHRKGTHQHVGFDVGGGKFWASGAWLESDWYPYVKECESNGVEPIEQEAYYNSLLRPLP